MGKKKTLTNDESEASVKPEIESNLPMHVKIGDMVGSLAMFCTSVHLYTVAATTPATLAVISAKSLRRILFVHTDVKVWLRRRALGKYRDIFGPQSHPQKHHHHEHTQIHGAANRNEKLEQEMKGVDDRYH